MTKFNWKAAAALAFAAALPVLDASAAGVTLTPLGQYDSGVRGASAAEIVAHDPGTQTLFVVNSAAASIDVLDIRDPTRPALRRTLQETGGNANSIAVRDGLVAAVFAADIKTNPGKVVFYDAATLEKIVEFPVGALPDMVTFTPDGRGLLIANEGESNGYGRPDSVDPEGSVTVVDLRAVRDCYNAQPSPRSFVTALRCVADTGVEPRTLRNTVGFRALNGRVDELRAAGIRIYGPGATVAQDLEPEYIAVSPDGKTAWVTLQEANAAAVIDISDLGRPRLKTLIPFGSKDHALAGNEFDASDRDNAINIRNWPVKGLYLPDAIASYQAGGETFYVTANEGDDRNDFIPGEETVRVRALGAEALDPAVFGDIESLRDNTRLGRLTVSPATAPRNAAGQFTELQALGGRSFSIWSSQGRQVFDSGSDFERITAARYPMNFNASNDNNNFDDRSDNKGPEPEGVVVGTIDGRTYAFIGLERIGGVMIYDVTVPAQSRFVDYVNTRDFSLSPTGPAPTDNGPEGLAFIPAANSPTGQPLLVIGNEVSGTTRLFAISPLN